MIQYLRTSLKASHCNGLAKSVNRIFCKKSEISQKGGIAESDGLSGDTDWKGRDEIIVNFRSLLGSL
jgi:hypothetical protein